MSGSIPHAVDRRIGLSLAGLVAVAILPLLLFGLVAAWTVVDQKKLYVADGLANTARALQIAVDRELQGQIEIMQMLGTEPSLDEAEPTGFEMRARRAVQTHSDWRNVALIDPATHLIVASALPIAGARPLTSSPAAVDEVARSDKAAIVGLLVTGQIVKEPFVQLLAPVTRNGKVRFVMAVVMDPRSLSQIFSEQGLPEGWTATILDTRMTISGRSRDPQRYVGKRATPTLADRVLASEQGMFTAINQEGETTYTVFSRSAQTGWCVAIGIPARELDGPILRLLAQWAGGGAALILVALALTTWVSQKILRARRSYEAALRDSQTRVQAALDDFNELVARLPIGVYRYRANPDNTGRFEYVSDRFCQQLSLKGEQVLADSKVLLGVLNPEDLPAFRLAVQEALKRKKAFQWEGRVQHGAGWRWIRSESLPIVLASGDILWNGIQEDITERKLAEEQLRKLSAAVEQSPASVVITDLEANIQYVNPRFTQVTGFLDSEVRGRNPRVLQSGKVDKEVYLDLWEKLTKGQAWRGELLNKRKDGSLYWEESLVAPILDAQGVTTHYVAVKLDITQRKRIEAELADARLMLQSAQRAAHIGDWNWDVRKSKLHWSEETFHIFGSEGRRDPIPWPQLQSYFSASSWSKLDLAVKRCLHEGAPFEMDAELIRANGSRAWVALYGTARRDEFGAIDMLVGKVQDITDRHRVEERMESLALHDGLTKLANRRLLEDRLDQAMLLGKRNNFYGAVLFIDLDNFKPLNDAWGHSVGDMLLIEVANRLRACVRETDTVARYGGDEFVVLLNELTSSRTASMTEALAVAEKIRSALAVEYKMQAAGATGGTGQIVHRCTASIGVALFKTDEIAAAEALRLADKAMYRSKANGRNQVSHGDEA